MPTYFVCTSGPMGGVSIVFVGSDRASCDRFINQRANDGEDYTVYVNDDLLSQPISLACGACE